MELLSRQVSPSMVMVGSRSRNKCAAGTREHKYLDQLLDLLEPFSIGTVYADNNYAYQEKISPDKLVSGKKNT